MEDTNLTARVEEMVGRLNKLLDVYRNIEEKRETVRPQVYEKVRREYADRIEAMRDEVQPVLSDVREHLIALGEREAELSRQKEDVDLEMEEIDFRKTVGDLEDDRYRVRRGEAENRLASVQEQLDQLATRVTSINEMAAKLEVPDVTGEGGSGPGGDGEPAPPDPDFDTGERFAEPADEEGEGDGQDPERGADEEPEGKTTAGGNGEGLAADDVERGFFENDGANGANGDAPPARLHILEGVSAGRTFEINGEQVRVGRDLDNQIQIPDPKVSRLHFMVERRKKAYLLHDHQSANGTYVNNRRVEEEILSDGDEIRVGGTLIQFRVGG